jgi:hypothetical protein
VSILQGITKANGYVNEVALVTKKLEDIETISTFPMISVMNGNRVYETSEEDEDLYKVNATFVFIGYIKSAYDTSGSANLTTDCDSLLEDIKHCLLLNKDTLFTKTQARSLKLKQDENIYDFDNNIATVGLSIAIEYFEI